MKRFLRIYRKDRDNIKMINQSGKGFELIILSDEVLNDLINVINSCKETGDELYIAWQMKFKPNNYTLYKNCKFSEPVDNFYSKVSKNQNEFSLRVSRTDNKLSTGFEKTGVIKNISNSKPDKPFGKKIKVTCEGVSFYSDSFMYKNQTVQHTKEKYKDGKLLERMLKIGELNLKSEEI